jgi:hypothetical protein
MERNPLRVQPLRDLTVLLEEGQLCMVKALQGFYGKMEEL